ncbi:hypothetical protein SLS53_005969 [Cytospora paraplurivora]|uniref:Glycosyl hydrolase family 88 n=1 Tax=Cytospora paraplurivora TaxID=2898453 RepID=A0AAN9U6H0_9PEZI
MPAEIEGIRSADVHAKIKLLIDGMVNIKDKTGEFLLRLEDGRVIDTKGWNDWEWTHGIGLYGIWKYYELTGDARWIQIIESWFAKRFAAGGTTKNINTMAVFLTLADLERTRFGGMQHVTYVSLHDEQLWDDTLMMTVLPLAKIGLVLNRPHYVTEAKRQFLVHVQYLFDTKTGLFFHGWEFYRAGTGEGKLGHNFAEARWARGNSWLTIAIPEFIELLDLDVVTDPVGSHLRGVLEAQCAALILQQAPSGLWRTLLDIPEDEGSYVETSATAGFAFGILKSRRKRYLDPSTPVAAPESNDCQRLNKAERGGYDAATVRAIKAVLDNVNADGELISTSFGTAMGNTLQHYKDIPVTSMPYGQAMAIMALVEFLRAYV